MTRLVALAPVALVGCGAVHRAPHYEPVGFPLAPIDVPIDTLPSHVGDLVGGRWIRGWTADDPSVTSLAAFPPETLYGLWVCARRWSRGAELDLLVDVGQGPRPVTLWWTPSRAVRIAWGPLGAPPVPVRPAGVDLTEWQRDLAAAHGFGGWGDGWTDAETGIVSLAVATLTPAEQRALSGVTLARDDVSPRSPSRELAYFDPAGEPPQLWFFDRAFDDDALGFVGRPDAPVPSAAMTALHEIGHTVADAPLRAAYVAYSDLHVAARASGDHADRQAATEAYRAYKALGRAGPVIDAWQAFRAGRPGPSTYGFHNRHESFAEAFALAHLDPAALDRALPGAAAWFTSGAHTVAAGLDVDGVSAAAP